LALAWSKLLKHQVMRKTQDLEKSREEYLRLFHQFKALLNAISDPIALFTPAQQAVWSNQAYEQEKQALPAQGENTEACFFNPRDCKVNSFLRECFDTGKRVETTMKSPNQMTWELKAYPIKDENNITQQVIAIATDVTEKRQLREEAARSARLASLGELAAGIAHEINNPNAIILLSIPILNRTLKDAMPLLDEHYATQGDFTLAGLDYEGLKTELPTLLKRLESSSLRIKRIVSDLQAFVALEEQQKLDNINLNKVVKVALRLLHNCIKKSTTQFNVSYGENIPIVKGNFQQLEQVVVNLVQNACQAIENPSQAISITTGYNSPDVWVTVTDNGPGITPENLDKLTDPFFTTKRSTGHAGLGLSVSSRILQEHGGHLHIDPYPGAGTTITAFLPQTVDSQDVPS